jgi:hypothetical protein
MERAMKPATLDIEIYRGDAFSLFFRVKEIQPDTTEIYVPLTSWTGAGQIRGSVDDTTVIASFTVTFANQTTYPGGVLLSLTAATTSALTYAGTMPMKDIGVYDIELVNDLGEPNTFLTGAVTLIKDVTRVA